MRSSQPSIPVTLLSGFLGSGKTTLLNQLVQQPDFRRALVIINEYGDTSLDHRLFVETDENIQVDLTSGCLCCTLRGDLVTTLKDALWRFSRAGERLFDRVVIESSGLADPAPILHTLKREPRIARAYHLESTVTLVDCVNGSTTLENHATARRQVSMADMLLLSKTALASEAQLAVLADALHGLNPMAPQHRLVAGPFDARLLRQVATPHADSSLPQVLHWLTPATNRQPANLLGCDSIPTAVHEDDINTFTLCFSQPVAAVKIQLWLSLMAALMGERMLRFKGVIALEDSPRPMVIHGVQHILHDPIELEAWPDANRQSQIVFITRGIERDAMAQSLEEIIGIPLDASAISDQGTQQVH